MVNDISDALHIVRGEFSKLRLPKDTDNIYKDECIYSFDTPFSDDGLFVNLSTFNGVGVDYLNFDFSRCNCKLYLNLKWTQTPKDTKDIDNSVPNKLAIGLQGGFVTECCFDIVKQNSLVVMTPSGCQMYPFPDPKIPEFVSNICQAIIDHDGMKSKMQVSPLLYSLVDAIQI